MRKINMKRKNRKDKIEPQNEEENGVDEKAKDLKNGSDEDAEQSGSESEPETKKNKKPDKRKSVSFTNKKSKKKEQNEEPQYEVEEVLDEKMVRGVRYYLIRWKGYEPESDSWEPDSTLKCAELIKKFKASRDEKDKIKDENGYETPNKKVKKDKEKDKSKKTPKLGKKSRSSKDLPEVDWESGDEFEVGSILDVYFKQNGKREFLVSWKGYPQSQNSWEPEENLDCTDLIDKFMNKVEAARQVDQKELRMYRAPTKRFTLNMYEKGGRRLSRRLSKKQRVQYHDAE